MITMLLITPTNSDFGMSLAANHCVVGTEKVRAVRPVAMPTLTKIEFLIMCAYLE